MKRCPECRRDYYDETLMYCLDDGESLLNGPASDEPSTAILADLPSEAPTKPQINTSRRSIDKRLLAAPLLLAILAFGGFLGYRYFTSGSSRQINSIAVMPFVNDSGNPEFDYLSDGMTDTLIGSLNQLPNLSVKARSSVFRYKGKETSAQKIGEELNVEAILNGRVVQRGQELTLYVELVDAETENSLWTHTYNKPALNLVALQTDVARDVADKLKLKLSGADERKLAKNYTENAEAYQLYLQGRYFWNKQTNKEVDKSIEYFQQAIVIDPNYALAYAGLADAYSLNVAGSNRERMSKAHEAALKAISLDNDLAEAHSSLGRILVAQDYDFAGAEREMRRAIELNPNYGTARHFLADLLSISGRHEEAFAENRRALELEPFSLVFNASYGSALISARRYDEAIAQLKKTIEMDTNFAPAHNRLSIVYEVTGKHAECVEERAKGMEINGYSEAAAFMRESYAEGGWNGLLRQMTGESRPTASTFYSLAVLHTALGENDKAFAALNKSYENHEITLIQWLKNDPRLDPLRDDPRFQELLRKAGFPQ